MSLIRAGSDSASSALSAFWLVCRLATAGITDVSAAPLPSAPCAATGQVLNAQAPNNMQSPMEKTIRLDMEMTAPIH